MLYNNYGVHEIFDFSDEFNSSLSWAVNVCKEIESLKLSDFYFKCQLRVDKVTDDLTDSLKHIGCWLAQVGIESGNQKTLDGTRKNISIEQVISSLSKFKKRGIKTLGFFMIFNMWEENGKLCYEDRAMCETTLKFAQKLISNKLLDYMSWSITTPMSGSPLFEICRKYGLIDKDEYFYSGLDQIALSLPNVTVKDVRLLKAKGTLLQAYSTFLSGDLNLKSLPVAIRKCRLIIQDLL